MDYWIKQVTKGVTLGTLLLGLGFIQGDMPKKEEKAFLLYFSSDNCPLCYLFEEEVLTDLRIQECFNEHYEFKKIDENHPAVEILTNYFMIVGAPTIVVQYPDKSTHYIEGYPLGKEDPAGLYYKILCKDQGF
ncbi:MAG: thioredoxin family protein [archaeon]